MPFRHGAGVALPRDRRSWLRILLMASLVIGVLALGWLQYHWIQQVSDAQELRERLRLQAVVRVLTNALDTEVTRAALFFSLPPEAISQDELQTRWNQWQSEAPWPQTVSGITFTRSTASGRRTYFVGNPHPVDLPEPVQQSAPPGGMTTIYSEAPALKLLPTGEPYLIVPVPSVIEPEAGPQVDYVVIHYDRAFLIDKLFPQLAERHTTPEDRFDFRFRLAPTSADASLKAPGALHYRPDCLMPTDGGGSLSVAVRSDPDGAEERRRDTTVHFGGSMAHPGELLRRPGQCQTEPPASGPMQLSVYRPGGSLGDLYRFRRRNQILTGLVFAVLLAGLVTLVLSTERARRLARLQNLVAAGISHELRSPLASLTVAAEHLRKGHVADVEQVRRYGDIIDAQCRRLRHIVDQSLAFSHINQRAGLPQTRTASVAEVFERCNANLTIVVRDSKVDIRWETQPDLPNIAVGPDVIVLCLTNLIENSIKYAASGKYICISARLVQHQGRPMLEFIVEDHGPGIPKDEAEAMFEPFYRGASAYQLRQPGSGLGLAIVKGAAEAQGGWVRLEPAVPHGCRFRLFFPAVDPKSVTEYVESETQRDVIPSNTAG